MVTSTNLGYGTRRPAVLARHKEQARYVIAGEGSIETSAHLARNVFTDVLSQQRFNVLQSAERGEIHRVKLAVKI
jgi:hypothetical protein